MINQVRNSDRHETKSNFDMTLQNEMIPPMTWNELQCNPPKAAMHFSQKHHANAAPDMFCAAPRGPGPGWHWQHSRCSLWMQCTHVSWFLMSTFWHLCCDKIYIAFNAKFLAVNLLGFNLWDLGVVTRKCTCRKSRTALLAKPVLEPCWNLPGSLLEPC